MTTMDIVIKKEPPDDDYVQAQSVPDDSQWQMKRSKLHNLLFGNHGDTSDSHGNASPRDRTPEPQLLTDTRGFAMVEHDSGLAGNGQTDVNGKGRDTVGEDGMSEEMMLDPDIVVKMENVEEGTHTVIPIKDPFQHQNGSPQLTNQESETGSLLKSMLTCPMANIEGPSLDSFKMSLNDTSSRKQDNVSELRQILQEKHEFPSEIRRMLTGPSKSGSVKSKPERSPALSSALSAPTSVAKSNPILSSSLFSTSKSPAATASASALLKQLSVRSRQTQREKSPSSSKSESKQQQKTVPVPRQGSPLCLDELNQCKTAKGADENAKEVADSSKHKSAEDPKAKAMVDMICNFSKFLQNSMAKHDFSAEQMKFIMEKAMQSASKVVTENAEKPKRTDSFKATAASFIENAIDDAIKSETATESDDKSTTMSDKVLKSLILDKSDSTNEHIHTVKEDTDKQSFISSRKRKSENQFDRASNGTNLEENNEKKRKLDLGPEHQRPAYSQNGLDRIVTHSPDIPTAITIKKEPVEYSDNYSEYNNSQDGIDDKTQQSSQSKVSNSSLMNALRSSTMVDDGNVRQVLSENIYIKREPEETPTSCNESEIDKCIDRSVDKANANENGLNKTGSVIDILKDQVSKSFKKPLGVEMKYRCQFCSSTFPNAVNLVKHIQKRHSEEKTGIEVENDDDPVKTSLEQARTTRPVLASLLSLFRCKFCGQLFENKVSLTMHERSHTNNSNKTCQCNLCGKIVSSEKYLKMHMYRHTGPNAPKGVQHKSNNESVAPKKGKSDHGIGNEEEMKEGSSNDTAEAMYNLKSVKTEPVDMNDEMIELESKDKHMYLQLISDDDKSLSQGVETEIASGPVEEALNEDNDSNQVIGKNNSKAHHPDLSLVKAEPTDENEIGKDITANESIKDSEEGDSAIKKLLYTSFLDEEIEKNLKESFDKDRHIKSTFDLDYTRKADSPTCHKCEICGLEFEHKGTLKVHQRGHASKTCRCQICGKTVTDKSYLKIHMRTHEPETNFGNQDRENWETVENRNKNALRCETCKLQFSSYGHFEMHQRMHNGEKAFKCDECGAGFANKNHLLSHQGVHSNLKPYKCSKCDLSFRQSSGLRLHMFVHDEEKPKKCPFCDASFSRKAHLDKHIRYHSGERPYSCEICSKSFVDKQLLQQHIKKVHANGNAGKRGPYKDRQFPGRVGEQLGPNWKGFQTVYDPSDKTEIPRSSYPCGVCGEAYDEIQLLVEHLETHNKTPEEDDESDALTEEQFSQMINDDSYDNMTNDEKAGNIDDNNDVNENNGSMLTDSTIRGLLNSTSVPDSSPGMPSMPNLGFSGLNVVKEFKCPFCDESFDLPGPRIRHIHEFHPINKDTSAVLDKDDPDYCLKQHLLADRTTAEKLYEDLKSNVDELNSDALRKNLNVNESYSKEMKSNVKSLSKSDGNSNMNVAAASGSSMLSGLKIPKAEHMDYEMVETERKNKPGSQDKESIKLPCPYCDRVYQRQSSRTRHINENHRDKKEAYKLIKEIRDRQGPFIVE